MKQTRKLTRRQRELLESLGVVSDKYRFCEETPKKLVFYNVETGEKMEVDK